MSTSSETLPFESVAIGSALQPRRPATASGQGSRRCQTRLRCSRSAGDRSARPKRGKSVWRMPRCSSSSFDRRRRAARLRLHHALHRRLVAGRHASANAGQSTRQPFAVDSASPSRTISAPVDDGAEDVEHEGADGGAAGGVRLRWAPRRRILGRLSTPLGVRIERLQRRPRAAARTTGRRAARRARRRRRRGRARARDHGGVERLAQRRERVRRRRRPSAAAPRPGPSRRGRGRSARPRGRRSNAASTIASSAAAFQVTNERSVPRTRLTQRARPALPSAPSDAAGDQAAAERQAAAQEVGLEADERARDRAAPHRRLGLVEAQAQVVAGGEPLADRRPRRRRRGRAGAISSRVLARTSSSRRAASDRCAAAAGRRLGAADADRRAGLAQARAHAAAVGQRLGASSRSAPGWRRSPAPRLRRSRAGAPATRRAGAPSPARRASGNAASTAASRVSSCTQQRANASSGSTARTCG